MVGGQEFSHGQAVRTLRSQSSKLPQLGDAMRALILAAAVILTINPVFAQSVGIPAMIPPEPAGEPHVCPPRDYYPMYAIRAHIEGQSVACFLIEPDGSVKNVNIIETSGNPDLDLATISCVSKFRYKPATSDGQPIEFPWTLGISWCVGHHCADQYPVSPETKETCRHFFDNRTPRN